MLQFHTYQGRIGWFELHPQVDSLLNMSLSVAGPSTAPTAQAQLSRLNSVVYLSHPANSRLDLSSPS